MHPLPKGQGNKFRSWVIRKNHVILIIWLIGVAISMPEYLMFRAEPFCYNEQYYLACNNGWPEQVSNQYTVFIYLITFAFPLSMLSYLYTRIGLKLWRRQVPGNVDKNRDLTMQTMRIKVIKMLFVVVILFAVSWLPLQTFSMILFLFPEMRENFEYQSLKYNIFIAFYFFSHWLSMAHSCLNPLIYCFMNDKFRSDLQKLLCQKRKGLARTNSSNNNNNNPKITIIINNNNNNTGCEGGGTCCPDGPSVASSRREPSAEKMLPLEGLDKESSFQDVQENLVEDGGKLGRPHPARLEQSVACELRGQPARDKGRGWARQTGASQTTISIEQLNWFSSSPGREEFEGEEEETQNCKAFV